MSVHEWHGPLDTNPRRVATLGELATVKPVTQTVVHGDTIGVDTTLVDFNAGDDNTGLPTTLFDGEQVRTATVTLLDSTATSKPIRVLSSGTVLRFIAGNVVDRNGDSGGAPTGMHLTGESHSVTFLPLAGGAWGARDFDDAPIVETTALRLIGGGQMLAGRHHILDTTGGTTATTSFEGNDYTTVDFALPPADTVNQQWWAISVGPHSVRIVGSINGETDAVFLTNDQEVPATSDGATWRTAS